MTVRRTTRWLATARQTRRAAAMTVVMLLVLALAGGCCLPPGAAATRVHPARDRGPLHYAANGNFTPAHRYTPRRFGFTLADVSTRAQLRGMPSGVKALVYLGLCTGVDRQFIARARPFIRRPRVFGFYLIDEPDPQTCPPATLKQESAWVHRYAPGKRTFVLVRNLATSSQPSYVGGYTHQNSGVDLFGVDPYPCRSELHGCNLGMVTAYVRAAEASGIPRSRMVPVYQAFGGGEWQDDGGGHFVLPTPKQARALLRRWATLVPHPVFDFVYSWGQQRGDRSLATASPRLRRVFADHNRGVKP